MKIVNKTESDAQKHWTKKAEGLLLNKKIVKVKWLTKEEAEENGWYSRPVAFQLNDGNWVFPMADDEGNDGGALAVGRDETLPVF